MTASKISSTDMVLPRISRALVGQASIHSAQTVQRVRSMLIPSGAGVRAFSGHWSRQAPWPMQRALCQTSSAWARSASGLWHQGQRMGQPLKNTVVRIPGPSSVENF